MAAFDNITALDALKTIASAITAGKTDAELNLYLEIALGMVSYSVFGDIFKPALVYLAAHFIALDDRANSAGAGAGAGGVAGPLTGERAGQVQRNYGFQMTGAGTGGTAGQAYGYDSTIYGQRYLLMRSSRATTKPLSTSDLSALGWL
jgi:hypothetical protein